MSVMSFSSVMPTGDNSSVGEMTYIFGNVRTGQILAELPLTSVQISNRLNDYGELRATLYLDATGFSNQTTRDATAPGLTYVVAERNGKAIWGGVLWARWYQSQAKVMQIYCKSLEAYPAYRFMPDFTATNTDQLTIFQSLWNLIQADAGSNFGLIIPSSFPSQTSVKHTIKVAAADYTPYKTIMDQLAGGDQGFDWTIDWTRSGNTYVKTLRAEQPFIGAKATSQEILTFDYPGNILNYYETDSLSNSGTNITTLGAGQGSSALVTTVTRPDLIDSGYFRLDLIVNAKDTTSQTLLNAVGAQQAALAAAPINTFKVQVKGDRDPVFGSYGLGDACRLSIHDAWNVTLLEKTTRIVEWMYTPPESDAVEEVELIFEGLQAENG